jgi:hypothetical protein
VDLLGVFKNASHLKGLCLLIGRDETFMNLINSTTQYDYSVQVELCALYTDASVVGPFIAKKPPQLEMLIIIEEQSNESGS